jgi:hypothetical protein
MAEDLCQEVMLVLHEKYAHVEEPAELLPLALQIVRFKLMSQRRTSQRRGEYTSVSVQDIQLPDLSIGPAGEFERKQMLMRLQTAILKRAIGASKLSVGSWKARISRKSSSFCMPPPSTPSTPGISAAEKTCSICSAAVGRRQND